MTTAVAEQTEKPDVKIITDRNTALLDIKLTLDEFAAKVLVEYDDRWRWHSWRVQGDESLYFWIYDHIINEKEKHPMISDEEVIKCAYTRLRAIQERRGQVNIHSLYVKDIEVTHLIEPKLPIHACVRVVKDRVDGLFRYSTSYLIGLGGGSSAPWIGEKIQSPRQRTMPF